MKGSLPITFITNPDNLDTRAHEVTVRGFLFFLFFNQPPPKKRSRVYRDYRDFRSMRVACVLATFTGGEARQSVSAQLTMHSAQFTIRLSKGKGWMGYPGYVMRGIKRAFLVSPDAQLRTSELFGWSYPRLLAPERKHYEVIRRAARKLALRAERPRQPNGRFGEVIWRLKTEADG